MVVSSKSQLLKQVKQRKYLNRDFDSLRADLLEYARTFFPNKIRDFSENSLGGLLLEMAAYVGDVQSFYLDHQFHELFPETAVETENIEAHINEAGVPVVGASPSVVNCTFFIEVPAIGSPPKPNKEALPIIHEETVVRSQSGIEFELTEDLDFRSQGDDGNLIADVNIGSKKANGEPRTFILSLSGICISGFRATESFSFGDFQPFKQFTLGREDVTEVTSVKDNKGNEYFEVEFLTQDTIFEAIVNRGKDDDLVKDLLVPKPAPYRYTTSTDLETRLTTLTFGGGSAQSLDEDVIPDPSEFAVPLFGKRRFSRFSINPGNLLKTTTLGVAAANSVVTISYRYGGGLDHNIGADSIRGISSLVISFPNNPSVQNSQFVRASIDAKNFERASGGEDQPTEEELKERIPEVKASQSRIVSKEDLLARIYTMPSNFGRVFRASVQPNPDNPLSTRLYIISRDTDNRLIISPDSLKKNLSKFLDQFRLVSDAIDILDAQIINIKVEFSVVIDPTLNKNVVLQNIISRLVKFFNIKNFDIDQPLIKADVQNLIFNNDGVVTVESLEFKNLTGTIGEENPRQYSLNQFDIEANTDRGIVFPEPGSIFELKFPQFDIQGTAR